MINTLLELSSDGQRDHSVGQFCVLSLKKRHRSLVSRLCFTMLRARQFARQAVPCGRRAFTSGKTMRAGVKYENMTIGIVKETLPLERRVAQSPESVGKLVKEGFKVPCPRGGA